MQQIILPYPINDQKLSKGSIERIDFGAKTFKIKIPEKARFGQMLRLRGLAEHIDDSFRGQDLLLLLKEDFKTFSSIRKDVLVELPINLDSLKKRPQKE